MSKKPTTAIVPHKAEFYAILKVEPARLTRLVTEYIGSRKMQEWELEGATIPKGAVTPHSIPKFTVPTLEGSEEVENIVGVVVSNREMRRYYPGEYDGGSDPPVCVSNDMETGIGHPGGSCRECPLAQWGSKDPANGDGKGAQACQHRRVLTLIRPDDILPFVVDLPPTSLKPALAFFCRLLSRDVAPEEVVISIGLEMGRSSFKNAEATFKVVERLPPELAAQFTKIRDQFGPQMKTAVAKAT